MLHLRSDQIYRLCVSMSTMYRFMKQFVIYLWHIDFFSVIWSDVSRDQFVRPMEIIDKSC